MEGVHGQRDLQDFLEGVNLETSWRKQSTFVSGFMAWLCYGSYWCYVDRKVEIPIACSNGVVLQIKQDCYISMRCSVKRSCI